jgi:phenylalanyl-tRNA synthetase beta chain
MLAARFERGVDPAFLDDGLAILTGHILDICGGEASRVTRAGEPPVEQRRVRFDPDRTAALGGIDVPIYEQQKILERLGFRIEGSEAVVPSWRRDVEGTADLVEEVTRIVGYDAIPATALPRAEGVARPTATRSQMIERRVRRAAAARGLDEAVTWSFIGADEAELFGGAPHVLANPISEEMKYMRPSLIPGLAAAVRRNADRGATSIRLFEVGRRYLADAERADGRSPAGWRPVAAQLARREGQRFRPFRCQVRSHGLAGRCRSSDCQPAAQHGARERPGIRADRHAWLGKNVCRVR